MDGNRRFALKHGWKPWIGHQEGARAIRRVIDFCLARRIRHLSLYAFSLENFKRPPQELTFLWDILIKNIYDIKNTAIAQGIRVRFIGNRALFPPTILPAITMLAEACSEGTALCVNILFCYGARQEIIAGIKSILHKIRAGFIHENDVSEAVIEDHLWTQGTPAPELILRTGGRHRLSNFLLYQAAYSELYFLDCLWPEITDKHLNEAVAFFEQCERNFGT